ncbi:uncharacterized protein LOC120076852 isoform X2 [Benincasa hispida]|uniref:uncharacterized protein LOC120076852 isoform X2 n=1 Tax=Benincasa hispida TaxID=102211 RepID=UPI0019019334|nr:uncharacterized protein LOC120076852 isoform X2 [Benincasa hispida]
MCACIPPLSIDFPSSPSIATTLNSILDPHCEELNSIQNSLLDLIQKSILDAHYEGLDPVQNSIQVLIRSKLPHYEEFDVRPDLPQNKIHSMLPHSMFDRFEQERLLKQVDEDQR